MNIPISGVEVGVILAFFSTWAFFLFGGLVWGNLHDDDTRRMPRWSRLVSSAILVIAAWIWFALVQGSQASGMALWFAMGITSGFVGDCFMAQILPVKDYVLGGIGAFAIGHVFYLSGIVDMSAQLNGVFPRWDIVAIWWGFAFIGWFIIVMNGNKGTILHYAALPYAILLASTTGFAFSLVSAGGLFFGFLAIGAALFLLSDLILAGQLFSDFKFPYIGDVVWLTYGPGQALIVFGVFLSNFLTG